MYILFFFKQKTAYEMRISDWSSDVCSSDLERGRAVVERVEPGGGVVRRLGVGQAHRRDAEHLVGDDGDEHLVRCRLGAPGSVGGDDLVGADRVGQARKSVVAGQRGSGRVVAGGRRIIKKKKDNM